MATSIKFYIKITKRVKEKQSYPIYLRVVHNRQKSEGRISGVSPLFILMQKNR
jgi:hypothetical protein